MTALGRQLTVRLQRVSALGDELKLVRPEAECEGK